MKIYDKRPVLISNGSSMITSAEGVASALGISSEDVILINSVGDAVYVAVAYLPYIWTVTTSFNEEGSVLLRSGDSIIPNVGEKIPSSLITKITFSGTIQ